MDETRWLDEDEQATWRGLLRMEVQLHQRLSRALQREAGMSEADYGVLVELSETPDERLRIFELGSYLQWEKSRLSHHLRRMEQRGLVERQECETDRRGAFVVLTEQGRVAIQDAAPKHVAEVRRAFIDALTSEQLDQLQQITGEVLAHLADHPED